MKAGLAGLLFSGLVIVAVAILIHGRYQTVAGDHPDFMIYDTWTGTIRYCDLSHLISCWALEPD